ncbi:hypothetical protein JOS77_06905 [Chromobacterium haemolyticum]|nr:hypothetical protein JOS77_06905 [Chromobacterium haemolyticum]
MAGTLLLGIWIDRLGFFASDAAKLRAGGGGRCHAGAVGRAAGRLVWPVVRRRFLRGGRPAGDQRPGGQRLSHLLACHRRGLEPGRWQGGVGVGAMAGRRVAASGLEPGQPVHAGRDAGHIGAAWLVWMCPQAERPVAG